MPKKTNNEPLPDVENPEWTRETFTRATGIEGLPKDLQRVLRKGSRGAQKAPTKTLISLRLSPDVLTALRATGKGWQSAVDEVLRRQFVK